MPEPAPGAGSRAWATRCRCRLRRRAATAASLGALSWAARGSQRQLARREAGSRVSAVAGCATWSPSNSSSGRSAPCRREHEPAERLEHPPMRPEPSTGGPETSNLGRSTLQRRSSSTSRRTTGRSRSCHPQTRALGGRRRRHRQAARVSAAEARKGLSGRGRARRTPLSNEKARSKRSSASTPTIRELRAEVGPRARVRRGGGSARGRARSSRARRTRPRSGMP